MSAVAVPSRRRPGLPAQPQRSWLLAPPLLLLIAFFFIPILKMVVLSLQVDEAGESYWSLENYQKLFGAGVYLRTMLNTFWLSLLVTILCAILGYPVAFYLTRGSSALRGVILLVVISPLLISLVARTFGWLLVLSTEGLINNLLLGLGLIGEPIKMLFTTPAVVAGLVHIFLPYMVLSINSVLAGLDERLEEAAANLGANPARTFWYVTLPLSLRGVATGGVIVFGLSVSAYAIPAMLGGGKVRVTALEIYERVYTIGDYSFAATLALVLLAATMVAVGVFYALAQRRTV